VPVRRSRKRPPTSQPTSPQRTDHVVAGPGNNGGDGFVAAAELAAQGREVCVILMCERDALHGDAASAARAGNIRCCLSNPQAIGKPALIIDALFRAGLSRPVEGAARR